MLRRSHTWSDDAVNPALTVRQLVGIAGNPTLPTVASVVAASSATDNCGTNDHAVAEQSRVLAAKHKPLQSPLRMAVPIRMLRRSHGATML
ncbi:MAG: hypothetical protein IPN89_17470 [Saprospiraceae bacterium]|nr:hypothetical protein [Saprospiraceae bacterium]